MRSFPLIVLATLAIGITGAVTADANHSHPATYTARITGGGSLEFDVSADGSAVTRVKATDVARGSCQFPETEVVGTFPITNHSFSHQAPQLTISGSFSSARIAQGTVTLTSAPACASGELAWTATTTAPPPSGVSPPASVDTSAPRPTIAAASPQRVVRGAIGLRVTCPDEGCKATARATIRVRGATATYRLGPATASLTQGKPVTLKLNLSRKARSAVRRALARGRRVTARVTVTVVDAAGNRSQATRTVRLRR